MTEHRGRMRGVRGAPIVIPPPLGQAQPHRAAVGEFHTQRWTLVPETEGAAARYRVEVTPAGGAAA